MTEEAPRRRWRSGLLRLIGVLAVLLVPIALAMLATRLKSSAPVVPLAWASALWLVAYPVYRFARRGVKRDYTVENFAWIMALLICFLATSPTLFPWDR
jgi:hypothetical protein